MSRPPKLRWHNHWFHTWCVTALQCLIVWYLIVWYPILCSLWCAGVACRNCPAVVYDASKQSMFSNHIIGLTELRLCRLVSWCRAWFHAASTLYHLVVQRTCLLCWFCISPPYRWVHRWTMYCRDSRTVLEGLNCAPSLWSVVHCMVCLVLVVTLPRSFWGLL